VPVALAGQLWYLTARLPGLTLLAEDKATRFSGVDDIVEIGSPV
jgi:hypothetical protein